MNLNFVRKKEQMISADFIGNNIIEFYGSIHGTVFRACNFDPAANTVCEISPEIKKYHFVTVRNCIYNQDKFYFSSYEKTDEGAKFSVYAYDFAGNESSCIFSFYEENISLNGFDRIKIFVLSSSNFLIQTEVFTPEKTRSLMGAISFRQKLYSTESGEFKDVNIPDFRNNGINSIIPVSENMVVVKCGFSIMEDKRFTALSENEALIESIYLTNSAQLIADISLNKTTGSMRLIDTAYFESCISTPAAKDQYIFYKIFNIPQNAVDINFVNTQSLKRFTYRIDDSNKEYAAMPLVIDNIPYIKLKSKNTERFINLTRGLEDMEFLNEDFICSSGNLLIFSKMRRGKECLRIYSYPSLRMICEEQCSLEAICRKNDEYYIYI